MDTPHPTSPLIPHSTSPASPRPQDPLPTPPAALSVELVVRPLLGRWSWTKGTKPEAREERGARPPLAACLGWESDFFLDGFKGQPKGNHLPGGSPILRSTHLKESVCVCAFWRCGTLFEDGLRGNQREASCFVALFWTHANLCPRLK